MEHPVHHFYGNRLRLRVCGICIHEGQMVMIEHAMPQGSLWAPPGGGIAYGEHAKEALTREFQEETGLAIEVCDFLFACELINPPLHAVELFFEVKYVGGSLKKGSDPETPNHQIINQVQWLSEPEIRKIDPQHMHQIFQWVDEPLKIAMLRGYFSLPLVAENKVK
jgi:8-oxo-dGTP diphosphatase